jgi:20S proteasome alpha/beta subunit
MTLVAGFRCRNGGVLLCADREENDGVSRREVEKIYEVRRQQGTIFVAGAGRSSILTKFHLFLENAISESTDLAARHVHIMEKALKAVSKQYLSTHETVGFVLVVASSSPNAQPLLYKTDATLVVPEPLYVSDGSGKTISDYLADRLYRHGLDKPSLGALAAFILRETEESTSGVGLGADMIFIHDKDRELHRIPKDAVREIQSGLPKLGDAVWEYWKQHAKVPKWLED